MGFEHCLIPPLYQTETHTIDPLPNLTNDFLDILSIGIKTGKMDIRSVLLYGRRGSGKTTEMNSIIHELVQRLGEDKVVILFSKNYGSLVEQIGKDHLGNPCKKPIIILALDDPLRDQQVTGGRTKEQTENIASREEVRHITEERLGTETGIIIEILASQRIHLFESVLREAEFRVFKTPLGDEEEKNIRSILRYNDYAYRLLGRIDEKILRRDDEVKSLSVVRYGVNNVGYLYFPKVEKWYLNQIVGEKRSVEKVKLDQDKIIEEYVNRWLSDSIMKGLLIDNEPGMITHYIRELTSQVKNFKVRTVLEKNFTLLRSKIMVKFQKRQEQREKQKPEDKYQTEFKKGKSFKQFAYELCLKDFGLIHAKILKLTIDGFKQYEISSEVFGNDDNKNRVKINRKLKDIQQRKLGDYFELWYNLEYDGIGEFGGNMSQRDYKNKSGKIVSLKCRFVNDSYKTFDTFKNCKPEIDEAIKDNTMFYLTLLAINWGEESDHYLQESPPIDPKKPAKVTFYREKKEPQITYM